ncbi:MAG TPA: zinc-binding dehydrogenase [Mycobacteriales bacterium]|nr:zinc-binding dehydrogenase [Mycobacteriales bacterium]
MQVEVDGCGVCGSNLPVWEGRPWFSYPLAPGAPGHEAWGRVAEIGAGVTEVGVGDPVAFLSDLAFAERVEVPAHEVVVLPAALEGQPFPGEALGCAFNIAARSGFGPDQTVCIVGAGFLGTLVGALAADAGAHVIAVSRRPFALDVARAMGAKDTVALGDDVVEEVHRLTDGALCDVVVEAVGAQWPLDLAGQLTKTRGRLVVAGFHQDGPRTVDMQLWNWRGIDVVNAHERDPEVRLGGIRAAAAAVASRQLDPAPLFTHTFPLHRLDAAFEVMADRPDGFVKALVTR